MKSPNISETILNDGKIKEREKAKNIGSKKQNSIEGTSEERSLACQCSLSDEEPACRLSPEVSTEHWSPSAF